MRNLVLIVFIAFYWFPIEAQDAAFKIVDAKEYQHIRESSTWPSLFDQSYQQIKAELDAAIADGIDVPMPKDLAGGYSHEKHKSNFFLLQKAAMLYQLNGDKAYADYIKAVFIEYRDLFPKVDKHPAQRSYARGKFFWQCLNDANWLVYASQAYAAIYDEISPELRKDLNENLFRPYAEFISIENPQFFNRIHNHSTWGNAGVGMIALVMQDEELLNWALYGLSDEIINSDEVDNDGGYVFKKGQVKAGFLAQIDESFSPDGYYTEGPYYQRYALYPFLVFAQALSIAKPELKIFEYRDALLLKSIESIVELSDGEHQFFPINDAQKGMSIKSRELVLALSLLYKAGGASPEILSLIEYQGQVPLNPSGFYAAKAISENKSKAYRKRSQIFRDGAKGDEGAIGVLRSRNNPEQAVLLKYGKHGMGHGHFDRLGLLIQDGKHEVIQDYGAARWVNIEHKDGGGYLKENKTWAKQTIAHNTLVINGQSQFRAEVKTADESHGIHFAFDTSSSNLQVLSAREVDAYPGYKLQRTCAMLELEELEAPLIIDIFSVENESNAKSSFQLPNYIMGDVLSTTADIKPSTTMQPMGSNFGYQHLWLEAMAIDLEDQFGMTWFNGERFYSIHQLLNPADTLQFLRIGANDPNFNLRRDGALVLKREAQSTNFIQAYEMHGFYSPVDEIPLNSFSSVEKLSIVLKDENYIILDIRLTTGATYRLCTYHKDFEPSLNHSKEIKAKRVEWTGNYALIKI